MKIHEYNEMMAYLTRPAVNRTGYYEAGLVREGPNTGKYKVKFPTNTKLANIYKGTKYGTKKEIEDLIKKRDKIAKISYKKGVTKSASQNIAKRDFNFKSLVDDIVKSGDLTALKSSIRQRGGKIPQQYIDDLWTPAIEGGKGSNAMKKLSRILGRDANEILKLDEGRKVKIKEVKAIVDTEKALAAVNPNKKKFLEILNSSDKINLKAVAKQLGLSQIATNNLINSVYKDIYKNTSLLGKESEIGFVRYLPNKQTPLKDLLRSMNKIEGVDKIERRTITDLLDKAIGFKTAKKYRNPELYTIFKDRINEYYKLKDVLPDNIKLNLDHPLPMNVIRQMGSEAKLQTLNVSPITQELNLGLKSQFDKAYGRAIKEGNTSVQKAIEKIVKQIDLPLTKVGSQVTDPSKFSFVSQDLKTQIISSLEKQKSIAEKLKKVDPKLLEKAGMAKFDILRSINTLLANANTETIMKVRKALNCDFASGGRVGLQGGGNLLECPMAKFAQDPEGTLNVVGRAVPETRTPIINTFKNFGAGTLKWGGRAFIGLTPVFAAMEIAESSKKFEEGVPAGQLVADVVGNWVLPGVGQGYETYQKRKMMQELANPEELASFKKADQYKKYEMLQEDPLREVDYGEQLKKFELTDEDKLNLLNLEKSAKDLETFKMERLSADRTSRPLPEIDPFQAAEGGRVGFDGGGSPLQRLRQEIVDSMRPYAPGDVTEEQLQLIVKDITLDMTAEQAQASAKTNFIKLFGMAKGGRVGFDEGSKPKSPGRRTFLKGITALAALPLVGKYFKLGKVLERSKTYLGPTVEKVKGMPEWFPGLVKKLFNEGEDVTKQVATKERMVVKRGTLEGGDEVDMIYDLDTGNVSIEVKPGKGNYETTSGAYNKEYGLEYTKGQADEMTKGKKPPDEFEVAELEGRADPNAMDVDWDGTMTTVDDAMSDLTELEAFAKNKTTAQIHKKKGTKPKDVFPDYDSDWYDPLDD